MKDDKAVQAALQVLKENAETGFEKLSVARLETALTNPPKVNVIDDTHQEFNGKIYSSDKKGHYSTHNFIHRDVYSYYNGEIPNGYVVHHRDFDKSNNALENLQLLSLSKHSAIHVLHHKPFLHKKTKIIKKCEWCGKEFETDRAIMRFCSHSCCNAYSANKTKEERICVICGKPFLTKKHKNAKTCSDTCRGLLSKRSWEAKRNAKHNVTVTS